MELTTSPNPSGGREGLRTLPEKEPRRITVRFMVSGISTSKLPKYMMEIPDFKAIHQRLVYNIGLDATWRDVLREECGVELDPEEYQVHKRQPDGVPAGAAVVKKHDLREEISVLMSEFGGGHQARSLDKPYAIYILKNIMPTPRVFVKFVASGYSPYRPLPAKEAIEEELRMLHLKVVEDLDVDLTWLDVIRQECGMEIDPEEFQLHKQIKKYGNIASRLRKHNLTEKCSVMMNTFGAHGSATPHIIFVSRKIITPRTSSSSSMRIPNSDNHAAITNNGGSVQQIQKQPGPGISVKFLSGGYQSPSMMAVQELRMLHQKVIENLDLNSTWLDVMRERCGVEMDPEEYQLHKRTLEWETMESVRKHDLREATSVMINTFRNFNSGTRTSDRPYVIYIVKKNPNLQAVIPVVAGSSSSVNNNGMANGIKKSNNKPMPLSKKMGAIAHKQMRISEQGRLSLFPLQQSKSVSRPKPRPAPASRKIMPPPRARAVLPPPQLPVTMRRAVGQMNEYDTRSNCSDDSQLDDLEEQGVRVDENLKAKVHQKTGNKYTNSCFLRAKKDMLELKRKNDSTRWARLNTELPTIMAIMQDLLNV